MNRLLICLLIFFTKSNVTFASNFDTTLPRRQMLIIGIPIHTFFEEGDGFNLPKKKSPIDFNTSKQFFISYEYNLVNSSIRLDYYSYFRLNPILYQGQLDPPIFTRISRGFDLLSSSFLKKLIASNKRNLSLQILMGGSFLYRFNGLDEIFLSRINPLEVRTDAIFYNRPGLGFIAEVKFNYKRRIELNMNANLCRFFEPTHYYQNTIVTKYGPNLSMSVIKFGIGYNFNLRGR